MIIFDLDGTLLNTLTDLHNALNYSLNTYNIPSKTISQTKMLLGNGIERLIADSIPNGTENSDFTAIYQTFKTYYTKHIDDCTQPYEGIMPLLSELNKRAIKTGIISNKFDEGVKILAQKYFNNMINEAQGTSETIRKKPNPDAVFELIKKLKAENETNIYVGDSEVDIQTAKNANLPCISVSWGFRTKTQLLTAGAKVIINSPSELLNYIC